MKLLAMKCSIVCILALSFCSQRGLPQCIVGYTPQSLWADTPWLDTPYPGQTPPLGIHHLGTHPLWEDTPNWADISPGQTPPTSAQCMLGYSEQAGGTHPTGMHSCFEIISVVVKDRCGSDYHMETFDSEARECFKM